MFSLTTVLFLSASLVAPATADFHFLAATKGQQTWEVILPSSQYGCGHLREFGLVTSGYIGASFFEASPVAADETICDYGVLDFYKQVDGHYEMFIHNGDGEVAGNCYSNSGQLSCASFDTVEELLVCYTRICGPA